MAINKNNQLKAEHTCYTAGTGGGKSVAVQYSGRVPASPHLAIWDPYEDYTYKQDDPMQQGFAKKKVWHYRTRQAFLKAFTRAWQSQKPFRVAYSPAKPTRDEFLWFCKVMWTAADGRRRLDVVLEEVARYTETSGKEASIYGELLTGGRKFGLVVHSVFQRSTEVPKTTLTQSPYKIIGVQEANIDAKRMAEECDLKIEDIRKLTPLTYIYKKPGWGNTETLDLTHVFKKAA